MTNEINPILKERLWKERVKLCVVDNKSFANYQSILGDYKYLANHPKAKIDHKAIQATLRAV